MRTPKRAFLIPAVLFAALVVGPRPAATLLVIDYGPHTFVDSSPGGERVGRDYGVQLRGYPAKQRLEYRLAASGGVRNDGQFLYVVFSSEFIDGDPDQLIGALKQQVRHAIGAFATPDIIHVASGLPKTRSGKIMRRILRKVASSEYEGLGDTSTLAEPDVVQRLIDEHRHHRG